MTDEQPLSELSKSELRSEVRRLRGELKKSENGVTRRQVIGSAVAAAGLGALGVYGSDIVSAQSSPSGTFPVETDAPLLRLRADRIRMLPRSTDPSSPDGGTRWVVE
jgi:hypothetical protein